MCSASIFSFFLQASQTQWCLPSIKAWKWIPSPSSVVQTSHFMAAILSGLELLCSSSENDEIHAAVRGAAVDCRIVADRSKLAIAGGRQSHRLDLRVRQKVLEDVVSPRCGEFPV